MTCIHHVRFEREAGQEFYDAVEWYESRSIGLGLRFLDEIESTIERIRLNPPVKAVIEVTPDGIFLVQAENSLKPGQHQVLIITQTYLRKDARIAKEI
jgi:hypothetical protein